jgi:hypothetical protein
MASHLPLAFSVSSAEDRATFGTEKPAEGIKVAKDMFGGIEVLPCGKGEMSTEWDRKVRLKKEPRNRNRRAKLHSILTEQCSSSSKTEIP